MLPIYLLNAARILLCIAAQLFLINNIELNGLLYPSLYLFCILMLPIEMPGMLVILMGFMVGGIIDIGMNTAGMHAASTTLLAFFRAPMLRLLSPRGGYEPESGERRMELRWFLTFVGPLIFVHHLTLFALEYLRFEDVGIILIKTLFSSLCTLGLVILCRYLFGRRPSR